MRALAVFPTRRELRVIDVPAPTLTSDREVLVRVRQVGICGTDREIASFHYGFAPPGSDALVLGHEALGEVIETGAAVRTLKPGDLVAITVRRPCLEDTCPACRAERQDFCVSGRYRERGIREADGFMTELIVEEERYLVRVPPTLADVGVLVEPLTVAAKGSLELGTILRRFPWEPMGVRALVLGAGPIGLLAAMMLEARHIQTWVYSREPKNSPRAELVRAFGGNYVSGGDTPPSELASIGPFDLVFEAVGNAKVAFAALDALAPNGVCILSGIPGGQSPFEIDLNGIMRNIVLKNQTIFGTVNASRSTFEASVRQLEQFMAIFPDAVQQLITHKVSLEEAPALLREPGGGIKQVVVLAG
jgi:threonine dehydrogenase-like Zn-dependent dehydrogenase